MNQIKHKIKSEHFYKFFLCPHWIWYDVYEDQKKHKHIPPIMEMLFQGKIQDPYEILPQKEFVEIDPNLYKDLDEAFLATIELMKQGKNIYKPVLMEGHWVGEPDFIEARPVSELQGSVSATNVSKSNFGDYYYVAYDIRNDPELRDEYKFPLVFASLILEKIQGIRPAEAYIIDADGRAKSFLIEPFIDQFRLTLKEIEKILEGEKPPPFLKSGCKRSPWFSICEEETKGCEDVSLIHGLGQNNQRALYDIGIRTVRQMAEADLDKLHEELSYLDFDKLVRLQNQAQVLISNKPIILQKYNFPKVKKEIYFDIESDPTRGIDYLFGILTVEDRGGNKKVDYQYFFAKDKSDEKNIWQKFLDFLEKLDDFVIYHYGYYEKHVLTRMERNYGAPLEMIRKFRNNALDLYRITVDSAVLPLYFYSLKDVAGFLGYKWSEEDAGGAESVVWYDQWLKTEDKKIFNKLVRYNEDDVRATYLIKEWLEKQKPKKEKMKLE